MNLRVLATSLALLTALALLGYGFHQHINALLGVQQSFLNSFWQAFAVAIGASILAAFAFPYARGVRRGDKLIASVPRAHSTPMGAFAFLEQMNVTALEDGWLGHRIKVKLANGRTGEGIVSSYAGTFSAASLQITETEIS